MKYICAVDEARARNYVRTQYLSEYQVVTDPEKVPGFKSGDEVVVVGTLPPELKKAVWDAWRKVPGLTKRWEY